MEYATSADGATWSDYTEAVNAATGERGFEAKVLFAAQLAARGHAAVIDAVTGFVARILDSRE